MSKDYNISKPDGTCCACNRQLQPEQEFMATICETDDGFMRRDFCLDCWSDDLRDEGTIGFWRSHIPKPQEKKKLFVDDEVLINFFRRLADTDEPSRVSFRYVLALILMRKKLLAYDRTEADGEGRDIWKMHFKGSGETHDVIDPHMDEDQILQVSQDLGQIMELDDE
jgi:hypothetical protein